MVLVFVAVVPAVALVSAYHIEPRTVAQSGWALGDEQHGIAEVITVCFDSLVFGGLQLFVGSAGSSAGYDVAVRTWPGLSQVAGGHANNPGDHRWATFDLNVTRPESVVKGKRLIFTFTRSEGGADSIEYYYDYCAMKWDSMIVPGQDQPPPQPLRPALAMRLYGQMNVIDSAYWGVEPMLPWTDAELRPAWLDRARDAGVGLMRYAFNRRWNETLPGHYWFGDLHAAKQWVQDSAGCTILAQLLRTPPWASTRIDSHPPQGDEIGWQYDTAELCAPDSLWPAAGHTNWWAKYVETLVDTADAIGCTLHLWEVWNEPNDTCWDVWAHPWATGWWRRPNRQDCAYLAEFDGLEGMAKLYMRTAWLADSVIRNHHSEAHGNDVVLIGSMCGAFLGGDPSEQVLGTDWLQACYDAAEEAGWQRKPSGISVHPYHNGGNYQNHTSGGFDPAEYQHIADTLRTIMRANDNADGVLWNSEVGWDTVGADTSRNARSLLQTFVSSKGSEAMPQGGYDGTIWWLFRESPGRCGHFPLLDSAMTTPYKSYYAFRQMVGQLTGRRLNGRVMLGDDRDDSCRIYEFEDPVGTHKTWVAWHNDDRTDQPSTDVALPLRADSSDTVALAYNELGATPISKSTGQDGWLRTRLTTRPTFYAEPSDETLSRPDLRVDSMRVRPLQVQVGRACTLWAFVSDSGTRPLPDTLVRVRFLINDETIPGGTVPYDTALEGTAARLVVEPVPAEWHGPALFSAIVNPGQEYVEKTSMDDNTGYQKTTVCRYPTGELQAVVSPLGKGNMPLLLVHLKSHSWEEDTTGSTPADSARVRQALVNDSGAVTCSLVTPWFCFTPDTVVRLLLGQGRYRVSAQFKDGVDNLSDWIADPTCTLLVFDSASATGTIELNSGARFTTTTACTLRLAAADSVSGVHSMRVCRAEPVQLVQNSGFGVASTHWTFSSAGFDSSGLGLAVLHVTPDSASWVRQDIPADSVSPLLGDTLRLSADLLVLVTDTLGDTCGQLRLRYVYADNGEQEPDSLVTVASVGFLGGTQALCGLNCLSCAFALPAPMSDTAWTWTAARVELVAGGPLAGTGSGVLYLDNVQLTPSGPAPDYTWWTAFDTIQSCTLSTGAGEHTVYALLQDSCGNENQAAFSDTIIYDPNPPRAAIVEPKPGTHVSGKINLTGYAYDPIEVTGDTWFQVRRLFYQATNTLEKQPVAPDSVSYVPVYADSAHPKTLGKWDATGLANGNYYLWLMVYDSAGNAETTRTWVTLANQKSPSRTGSGPTGGEVSLNSSGDVFVGSASGKIVQLDEELDSLSGFVFTDSGQAAYVAGITELDSIHLLATDLRTGDVTKMTKQGTEKQELVQNLDLPVAVSTDRNGNIWTLDKGESQLYKHRPDGTLALTIGSPGTDSTDLSDPEAFTINDSLVYIADTRNDRIAVYDTTGTLIELIAGQFQEPCAIAVTEDDRLYIVDKSTGTIEGLNSQGGHLLTIAAEDSAPLRQLGTTDDQLSLVTLKPGTGDILQYEVRSEDSIPGGVQSNATIHLPQSFTMDQPRPNPMRNALTISYALPRAERVTVTVHDIAGRRTRTLSDQPREPGYYRESWDRTDSHGRTVPNGIYFVEVRTQTESDRKKVVLTR
jgi:hypothetical protein